MPWDLVTVMPAANIPYAVEAGDDAVIPPSDYRYQGIRGRTPEMARFLDSFRTMFGHALRPPMLVRRQGRGKIKADDAVALRNIVAVAAVIRERIARCHGFSDGPPYSDLFELSPVSLGADATTLVVQTALELGLDDDLNNLQGQPTPVYAYPENVHVALDETLLRALVRLYRTRKRTQREFRRRVFRSLELAYYALAARFSQLRGNADVVLPAALWVSAFEMLCHRGVGNVGCGDVLNRVRAARWYSAALKTRCTAQVEYRRPRGVPLPALPLDIRPVRVYQRLYRVRNKGFHGDELPREMLRGDRRRKETHLDVAVPAIYRSVLLLALAAEGLHRFPIEPKAWQRYGSFLQRVGDEYEWFEAPLVRRCHQA